MANRLIKKYLAAASLLIATLNASYLLAEALAYQSKADIKSAITRILQSSEFQKSFIGNIWDRVILAIIRIFLDVFYWLGGLYETNLFLYWLFLTGCLLLLVLLIWHITYTLRKAFFLPVDLRGKDDTLSQLNNQSEIYKNKAIAEANNGNYTDAIRYLFISLVFFFDKKHVVNFNPSYTNREYLRLAPVDLKVYTGLNQLVTLVDEKWYGQTPSDQTEYSKCLDFYRMVVRNNKE